MRLLLHLTAIMACATLAFGQTPSGPQMTIKEKAFDFGYVPQNSEISHVFWLYSTGTDSLKIINVKPG